MKSCDFEQCYWWSAQQQMGNGLIISIIAQREHLNTGPYKRALLHCVELEWRIGRTRGSQSLQEVISKIAPSFSAENVGTGRTGFCIQKVKGR